MSPRVVAGPGRPGGGWLAVAIGAIATVALASGGAAARSTPRCHAHGHARRCRARPRPAPRPTPGALSVHAHEYRLTLSRPAVRGGRVVVEFDNEGQDPHNLQLAPVTRPDETTGAPQHGFATLSAGRSGVQTLTLTTGTWRLWCSLPGHDTAGMHVTLRVS